MEEQICESDWKASSSSSLLLARSLDAVLSARRRDLDAAFSRPDFVKLRRKSGGLLDGPLLILHEYVQNCVGRKEPMDHLLVPMIESVLKSRGSKTCKQILSLIQWLFEEDDLFIAFSSDLVGIIRRKTDHYISLGWCIFIRSLIAHEFAARGSCVGKADRFLKFLKILSESIPHLSSIVSKGSISQDGFELPTRLAIAAADCILVLTEAFTEKQLTSDASVHPRPFSRSNSGHDPVTILPPATGAEDAVIGALDDPVNVDTKLLLWDHLDELISLVQNLQAWNKKSRPLHAKGLAHILKWLQIFRGNSQDELMLKTGQSLLVSCWKHYVKLLHLEDSTVPQKFNDLLSRYLEAMQIHVQEDEHGHNVGKYSAIETRKFFLNCIALILGRLESTSLELALSESGQQMLNALFLQIKCTDEDVTEGALSILRLIIFRLSLTSSGSSPPDVAQMEATLPMMLNLLDERDAAARAVVSFIAEYCFLNPDRCLQEIFTRLDSNSHVQRRNAMDVVAELLTLCTNSGNDLPFSLMQEIAKHLLERLGDEELVNRVQAANIFCQLDPNFVVPSLVMRVYSSDKRVQSAASGALVTLLKSQTQKLDTVFVLIDCLRNVIQPSEGSKISGQVTELVGSNLPPSKSGPKFDIELVLRLIPEWTECVEDWTNLIEPLVDKMFSDPSNAVFLRFLSYISDKLADLGDTVLHLVLLQMKGQREIDKTLIFKFEGGNGSIEMKELLFNRLAPLLIIRLLPLRVLDVVNSSIVYGKPRNAGKYDENANQDCIADFLSKRAFNLLEFEDVRKVAAELCGRLLPEAADLLMCPDGVHLIGKIIEFIPTAKMVVKTLVILPVIEVQMEHSMLNRDMLIIKACLFATCTSLMIRGKSSLMHPVMTKIRKMLESILLWPSLDSNEVSKLQHGCIDCLAFMLRAELQTSESSIDTAQPQGKVSIVEEAMIDSGDASAGFPVLAYIIQRLTCQRRASSSSKSNVRFQTKSCCTIIGLGQRTSEKFPLPFRLCMANALISACQKISGRGKLLFAQRTFPELLSFVEVMEDPDVKAACLQVLFTSVYHLKAAILPYSNDLLHVSMVSLRRGSEKERIAGAKLLASLMASEDVVVESISASLWEAKSILESISMLDNSSELRLLCEKLLCCITTPLDDISPLSLR